MTVLKNMLERQLSNLAKIEDCILYNCKVYERLYTTEEEKNAMPWPHKYRYFVNSDDYDYVDDAELEAKIDAAFEEENYYLTSNGL